MSKTLSPSYNIYTKLYKLIFFYFKMEKEEELGLVVKSKEYALWHRVQEETTKAIENLENELVVNKEILKIADAKLIELD